MNKEINYIFEQLANETAEYFEDWLMENSQITYLRTVFSALCKKGIDCEKYAFIVPPEIVEENISFLRNADEEELSHYFLKITPEKVFVISSLPEDKQRQILERLPDKILEEFYDKIESEEIDEQLYSSISDIEILARFVNKSWDPDELLYIPPENLCIITRRLLSRVDQYCAEMIKASNASGKNAKRWENLHKCLQKCLPSLNAGLQGSLFVN